MNNWLHAVALAPAQAEEPGVRFAPRRIDETVKSRRVFAPNKRLYQKRRHILAQRGVVVTAVDAHIVQAHVNKLCGYGMNYSMIAAAAGCSHMAVNEIACGERTYVQRHTADRLLAVTPHPHPHQRYVLAVGAVRRIRALQAIGWSLGAIAEEAGDKRELIAKVGSHPRITYARWRQIADVYERLSAHPGSDKRARTWAEKRSWASPMAWEGIDIDHPDSGPLLDVEHVADVVDEVLLQRIIDGRHIYPDTDPLRGPERAAVIDHAIAHGWLRARLAAALNISTDGADQALVRRRRELREEAAA